MLKKMGGLGLFACGILLLCAVSSVESYSKYGRGCADIGCLPNEECVITSDSCSYNQRDGKDCGSYPTCKRKAGGGSVSTSSSSSSVYPSGSSLKPGPELNIFSAGSSNPTLNTHAYINHNGNGAKPGSVSSNGYQTNGYQTKNNNNNNYNSDYGSSNGGGGGGGNGSPNGGGNGQNGGSNNGGNGNNPAIIDPHYVFGAPQSVPILPNLPIFPYNSPTVAPAFQQFPQPNHPGSVLNPGRPQNGMQPLNPYNSPFVFGQQPFYNAPGGTGGPPGGSSGILGGSGGGLAPYPGGYPSPNSYNKPPPQYQNQNPYNRQTQTHAHSGSITMHGSMASAVCKLTLTLTVVGVLLGKMLQIST